MTQVPYDDIRRALEKARNCFELWFFKEHSLEQRKEFYKLAGFADCLDEIRTHGEERHVLQHIFAHKHAEALLADAQRWRMIVEPSEETVEVVARAIDRFQRGDDFLWRTEVDTARAVLRILEGLIK